MSAVPPVSMGLPVYNGIPHVKELIESLLAQTFGDFELVISDNASEDGTGDLCRHYEATDPRVRYYRNSENIGLIRNTNLVVGLTRAPYFCWASHDDLYDPRYLEVCLPPLRDDPSISVSHSQTVLIDDDGNALPYDQRLHACIDQRNRRAWLLDRDHCATSGRSPQRFRQVLAQQIMCAPIYGLMPRRHLIKTGLQASFFDSDKLLLAEMALLGRFHIAPEKLFKKRMHTGMASLLGGKALQKRIDPAVVLHSRKLAKLRGYTKMLAKQQLSVRERLECFYWLAVHSASSSLPETLRYRPELIWSRIMRKGHAVALRSK